MVGGWLTGKSGPELSIGQAAGLACLLEVSAPKPGNVHRSADFETMGLNDFLASAVAIQSIFERAAVLSVGELVCESIVATRRLVGTNTNLGIVLLLAPLAKAASRGELRKELPGVLGGLTPEDSQGVYRAIGAAIPGGMGEVDEMDVRDDAPADLLAAMGAAEGRDRIARQYVHGFEDVLKVIVPGLDRGHQAQWRWPEVIVHEFVASLARWPDSLIGRKLGEEVAREASLRAGAVLECGGPGDEAYLGALADLDFWLRSDGQRRNPGTTADLICAGLFVGLVERRWKVASWT